MVKAFTKTGDKKHYIAKSNTVHLAFSKKYTNVKTVKAPKKVSVKKGGKKKLSVKLSLVNRGRKIAKHIKTLHYKSSNKKVASVTKNGVIKAKKKGSCTVTITAQSGVTAKVKVVVK